MLNKIKIEIQKAIIGQEELIDNLLIGLLTGGHILVEGVPGLAKTTAIKAIAKTLGINFSRVQFTPDLLPSDLLGGEIYNPKTGEFHTKHGPIFTNFLLADEINRAPAKVQSALLEAMAEKQITIGEQSFKLDSPFLVMATQNPVEQEGTYQLPEAQLDRFMLKTIVDYNSLDEELEIMQKVVMNEFAEVSQVASLEDIKNLQNQFKIVHIDAEVKKYITQIIFATRYPQDYDLGDFAKFIAVGASPRASIDLYKATLAKAFIRGNDYATPLDVAKMAPSVLQHRISPSYEALSQGINAQDIITQILSKVKAP